MTAASSSVYRRAFRSSRRGRCEREQADNGWKVGIRLRPWSGPEANGFNAYRPEVKKFLEACPAPRSDTSEQVTSKPLQSPPAVIPALPTTLPTSQRVKSCGSTSRTCAVTCPSLEWMVTSPRQLLVIVADRDQLLLVGESISLFHGVAMIGPGILLPPPPLHYLTGGVHIGSRATSADRDRETKLWRPP